MSLLNFVKIELNSWGKYEKFFFPLGIILITIISFIMQDSKIAILSAVCGIIYTILAGKGNFSCYFFGITATLCYAWLAFSASLYGNFILHIFYYFPMEIAGIFNWKNHLKNKSSEIIKTQLTFKMRTFFLLIGILATIGLSFVIDKIGGEKPFFDALTCVFSVLGMFFTVKRCIEQWFAWMVVNAFSAIMWLKLYLQGANCFVLVLKWAIYLGLAFYFLHSWQKEILKVKKRHKVCC